MTIHTERFPCDDVHVPKLKIVVDGKEWSDNEKDRFIKEWDKAQREFNVALKNELTSGNNLDV